MKGIDVSSYQGKIDWSKVKAAGVQFAILKVIRKDLNPDTRFEENWSGCQSAGLTIQGVYNYSYATSVAKAQADAKKVVQILNGRNVMVWMDVEDKCQQGIGTLLVDIINAYADVIQGAGLAFGVYTGQSFYNSYIKQYASQMPYQFWIARYPSKNSIAISFTPDMSKKPSISNTYFGWQYSSTGKVPGIAGNVDLNLTDDTAGASVSSGGAVTHIQPNYLAGNEYRVQASTLLIRTKPSESAGNVVMGTKTGALVRGSKVKNGATMRVGNQIWMYIGLDSSKREMWICADNGSISYVV